MRVQRRADDDLKNMKQKVKFYCTIRDSVVVQLKTTRQGTDCNNKNNNYCTGHCKRSTVYAFVLAL